MNFKSFKTINTAIAFALIGCIFFQSSAHAYVDPGSGSVFVTTVLGLIAAVGFTFRKFFYNLRAKLTGKKNQESDRSLDD